MSKHLEKASLPSSHVIKSKTQPKQVAESLKKQRRKKESENREEYRTRINLRLSTMQHAPQNWCTVGCKFGNTTTAAYEALCRDNNALLSQQAQQIC